MAGIVVLAGALGTGCQISDSLADGFYGGISSVVSGVISEAILSVLQAGG